MGDCFPDKACSGFEREVDDRRKQLEEEEGGLEGCVPVECMISQV